MSIAIYPGSFDPVTLGHLNILKRASRIFEKVYVCVMVNSGKQPVLTLEQRLEYLRLTTGRFPNVIVDSSDKLLVDYAKEKGAKVIVKGMRAVSDFDWEFQMALANSKIAPDIDTMFLMASQKYMYLSSTIVKEMARYGVDLSEFIPREIIDDFVNQIRSRR
jgi:pantetheine-phosphate adenylyltransferase